MRNRGRGAHAERALVCLCALAVVGVAGANNATNTTTAAAQGTPKPGSAIEDFRCSKCVTRTIRAMFIQSSNAMENRNVGDGALNGASCDDVKTAVPGCFDYKNWNGGWVGALFREIFDELGAPVAAMTRANFSQASYDEYVVKLKGGSSFTRCVYEIRLGNVDVCVSDFWETTQRRKLTPFTSPMLLDNMRLLTMPKGKAGMDTIAGNPHLLYSAIMAPYKMECWYAIWFIFVFAGAVIWILESPNRENDDFVEDHEGPGKPLGLAKAVWLSWMGFLGGSALNTITAWPGRLAFFGFAFFIYMTVATYAANLAAFMVTKPKAAGYIDVLSDIPAKAGAKVCLLEAMAGTLQSAYGISSSSMFMMDDYGPAIEKMYRLQDGCIASVVGRFQYDQYIASQGVTFKMCTDPDDVNGWTTCTTNPDKEPELIEIDCECKDDPLKWPGDCPKDCPYFQRYCRVKPVDDPDFALSIPFSLPAQRWLTPYITAWIVSKKLDGSIDRLVDLNVKQVYCPVCGKKMRYGECGNATGGGEEEGGGIEGQLGLEDMAGAWTMSGIIMFFGGMLQVVQSIMFRGKGAGESAEAGEATKAADEADVGVTAEVGIGFVEGSSDLDSLLTLVDEMTARMAEIEATAGAGKS